jgi:hypothetical protein
MVDIFHTINTVVNIANNPTSNDVRHLAYFQALVLPQISSLSPDEPARNISLTLSARICI